ncbi:hypothetical protein FRC17_005878, partial [Serendipita sp. 399]
MSSSRGSKLPESDAGAATQNREQNPKNNVQLNFGSTSTKIPSPGGAVSLARSKQEGSGGKGDRFFHSSNTRTNANNGGEWDVEIVYTDGACPSNGREGAVAGI